MLSLVFATTNSTTNSSTNANKITKGFSCLETKTNDCSSLTNQEIALTIMATPSSNFDKCVQELQNRKTENNWGNVRDTALAVLALNHAGITTVASESWLIDQSKTPTDLIWYAEEDSDGETECSVSYDSADYKINIGENKKIDQNAGTCLKKSQSNYWLEVSPECYDKEFSLTCNKNFITTLLYKNKNSPTIYVLEGTNSAQAYGKTNLKINSKCFGDTSCDYEASLWATLALLKTGHNVEEYIPYVIALSDSNKRFFPDSFIYSITSYDSYATKLISSQRLGDFWEADRTAYNRYYDTSLAVLSMNDNTDQIKNSKDWLLFSQSSDGCWQGIKETAIALWALEKRQGKTPSGQTLSCTSSNHFCIPSATCPTSDMVPGYYCPATSESCCMKENLKSCSEYSGQICASGLVCTGNSRKATDTNGQAICCTGECKERSTLTECEQNDFICKNLCSSSEVEENFDCNSGQYCCSSAEIPVTPSKMPWWIYMLIILIIIVIIVIIWLYREKLKLWWFKVRTKYKKDGGNSSSQSPSSPYPPRPGFPPVRRFPPQAPPRRQYNPENNEMSDVFKKLKDMSK